VRINLYLVLAIGASLALCCGCDYRGGSSIDGTTIIRNEGSDTMVNIAQAWAEQYHQQHPKVSVQVLGGGSGVGIASLIEGNCDMANASRTMEEKERAQTEAKRGAKPEQFVVGYDALAIYVHKRNPLDSISLEELAAIYGEGWDQPITRWSELGVSKAALGTDVVTRISRQNSSGTYAYFCEAVLGRGKDMRLGSINQSGSKDVVALVSRTPSAIGYSGMGYATPEIKMLKVSRRRGEPGVAPTTENVRNHTYPITRPLLIYTVGKPSGRLKDYLDWILAKEGQEVVLDLGYVPLDTHE
jgi:phosphate transport system substrate-binding protein